MSKLCKQKKQLNWTLHWYVSYKCQTCIVFDMCRTWTHHLWDVFKFY